MALTDILSGLANRRAFDDILHTEVMRATRYNNELSLIILDLDSFKEYNDKWGHPAGDIRLREMADLLRSNVRDPDLAARYGGEEFAIVLPEIDHYNAMQFAEKIRKLVEVAEFKFEDAVIPVTVSIGVSSLRGEIEDALEFIKQADTNLFAAKEGGRNRVVG